MDNIFVIIKNGELVCYACTKVEADILVDNIAKESISQLKKDTRLKVFREETETDKGKPMTCISHVSPGYLYDGQISTVVSIHYEEISYKQ